MKDRENLRNDNVDGCLKQGFYSFAFPNLSLNAVLIICAF